MSRMFLEFLLWRTWHEQRVRTRTMKIIDRRAPRLKAPPGHGGAVGVFSKMVPVIDPPRGALRGGGVHRK